MYERFGSSLCQVLLHSTSYLRWGIARIEPASLGCQPWQATALSITLWHLWHPGVFQIGALSLFYFRYETESVSKIDDLEHAKMKLQARLAEAEDTIEGLKSFRGPI